MNSPCPFARSKETVAQGRRSAPERSKKSRKILRDSAGETKLTGPQIPPIQNSDGHALLHSGESSCSSAPPPLPQALPHPLPPPSPHGKSRHLALSSHVLGSQSPSVGVGQRRRPAGFQRGRRRCVLPAPAAGDEVEARVVAGVRRGAHPR